MQRFPERTATSMAYSATSVLPAPVGADTSTLRPSRMASTAWSWKRESWKPFQPTTRPSGPKTSEGGGSSALPVGWAGGGDPG